MTPKPQSDEESPYVIHTGEFQDVSLERPALRRASASGGWTVIVLAVVLVATVSASAYFVLPLYRELQQRRLAAERFEPQLLAANKQIVALQLEKVALDAAKTQLANQLAERASAQKALTAEAERIGDELGEAIPDEIKKGEAQVRVVNAQTVLDMNDGVLFDAGKAELNERGKMVLQHLGEILAKVDDKVVQIGAHTDTAKISGKLAKTFATSWELTSARSTTIVRFLEEQAKIPGARLVAVGFSTYRPVTSNSSSSGRRKNRRIEIALLPLPVKT